MAQESAAISITIGSKNNTSSGEYINAHTKSEMKDNAILKKLSSRPEADSWRNIPITLKTPV
jgi:hypothetical protein